MTPPIEASQPEDLVLGPFFIIRIGFWGILGATKIVWVIIEAPILISKAFHNLQNSPVWRAYKGPHKPNSNM